MQPAGNTFNSTIRVIDPRGDIIQEKLDDLSVPLKFALGNNFPNPFNTSTLMDIEIPISTELSLEIHNLLGQRVKTLHHGKASPGQYQFKWDGRDDNGQFVASGLYVINFRSIQFHESKKVLFVR